MENQHRKIKGYRELTQVEIDLMNEIKTKGVELAELITTINDHHLFQREGVSNEETARLNECQPERWCAIAKTHFQEGLMALTRSVAQPGFF